MNSGVNAAWVLVYLADNPKWLKEARKEVSDVAAKYSIDKNAPLIDQLSALSVEWENEFQFLDMCLKDSIRLQLLGTAFRKIISGGDVQVGKEVILNSPSW